MFIRFSAVYTLPWDHAYRQVIDKTLPDAVILNACAVVYRWNSSHKHVKTCEDCSCPTFRLLFLLGMLLLGNWNVHHAQRKFSCDIQDIFFIGEHKCYDLQKDVSCIIFMYMADCLHPIHVAPSCWAMTHCIAASSMSKFSSLLFICYRANARSTRLKPSDSFASLVSCASPYFSNGG